MRVLKLGVERCRCELEYEPNGNPRYPDGTFLQCGKCGDLFLVRMHQYLTYGEMTSSERREAKKLAKVVDHVRV
ncbi:hypothetical protein TIN2_36 [Tsukamurella phage TIN2]|uniref:Uncharacterized protein n=1 Tax=Tsukamurella phage TIN2 TaxID=1636545 RepID=A0A0K0N572_9CAUD|nr:hypothetical protein AVT55_gp087 [Tsukamurella phage TIN2]AKJ71726.1 hypothetical protein TIN2_36 [Tsukamurella phage TIN2]